uniref:Uncharacterized protein n=1 Tax=Glossina palpalis gambiensis TaxID=67801 RepID=A0A1B0BK14_9MUSC
MCESDSSMEVNQLKCAVGWKKCIESCLKLREAAVNLNVANITKKKTFGDAVKIPVTTSAGPDRQNREKTKADLTKNVDAKTIKISNVRCRKNVVVVTCCGGDDERNKAKAAIKSSSSNDFVVHTLTKLNPRSKITDMNFKYHNESDVLESHVKGDCTKEVTRSGRDIIPCDNCGCQIMRQSHVENGFSQIGGYNIVRHDRAYDAIGGGLTSIGIYVTELYLHRQVTVLLSTWLPILIGSQTAKYLGEKPYPNSQSICRTGSTNY